MEGLLYLGGPRRVLLGFTGIILPPAMPPGTEPPQCEQKQHPQLGNKYNKCKGEPTTQNHQHGRKTNTMEEKTTANRIHNPDGS